MRTMTAQQLKTRLDRNEELVLLNVLAEEEFERTHIPGSRNIPVGRDDFADRVLELAGGKDATIVVYCASTDCDASPKAARKLEKAGFTNVFDFEGGLKAWREAGYALVRPQTAGSTA